jgi:hypothetical protein
MPKAVLSESLRDFSGQAHTPMTTITDADDLVGACGWALSWKVDARPTTLTGYRATPAISPGPLRSGTAFLTIMPAG